MEMGWGLGWGDTVMGDGVNVMGTGWEWGGIVWGWDGDGNKLTGMGWGWGQRVIPVQLSTLYIPAVVQPICLISLVLPQISLPESVLDQPELTVMNH